MHLGFFNCFCKVRVHVQNQKSTQNKVKLKTSFIGSASGRGSLVWYRHRAREFQAVDESAALCGGQNHLHHGRGGGLPPHHLVAPALPAPSPQSARLWLDWDHLELLRRCPPALKKVAFLFFTLLLFPINLWLFELDKNLSIPVGCSYLLGWLVFVLYITCAVLCYFNHKSFWRVIRIHPTATMSCGNDPNSIEESLSDSNISNTINNHKKFLNSQ
ncbi:outer dense fiber protein 4 isoform X2 [Ochotona princeps]|uniref:outer dense fiber protein 4 isoform X2 n=1 Tax=Ochotona princeps TaxID=9978 RepID=UPI00271512D4|nr:outer dense fiber protein 4 isoform X2 [Ochotona princeps]